MNWTAQNLYSNILVATARLNLLYRRQAIQCSKIWDHLLIVSAGLLLAIFHLKRQFAYVYLGVSLRMTLVVLFLGYISTLDGTD